MKNILYLSYDGMTDPLGQSQVIPYLAGLSAAGWPISIISFEKAENERETKHIRSLLQQHNIKWHPLTYTKKPPVLSTVYDIGRMSKEVKRIVAEDPSQYIIHCRSYISGLIGLSVKRKLGTQFLFDMRGFWADERVEGNIWTLNNPVFKMIYRFFKKKEKAFFTSSDYTVSLTHLGKREIHKLYPDEVDSISPIEVIPCCVDNDLFDYRKIEKEETVTLKEKLNITSDQFVLGYVGSIGTWYMLPEMVAFFKTLLNLRKNAVFLFVSRENPAHIEAEFDRQGIDHAHLRITSSARNEMPLHIATFDWSVFFIKPVFSKKASSPTKQGEIMSMGVPIVCNADVGDTEEIILKYDAGIVTRTFDDITYAAMAEQMKSFNVEKEKIRRGAIETFDLQAGIRTYERIYQTVSNGK